MASKNKFLVIFLSFCLLLASTIKSKAQVTGNGSIYFVTISAKWCFACKMLDPIIEELKSAYGNQVTFIDLDVTNAESVKNSEDLAKEYGISEFFASRKLLPTVGIFCSSSTEPEERILGAYGKENYEKILSAILTNGKTCDLSYSPISTSLEPVRPDEVQYVEVTGDRPQEIELSGRPNETTNSERPDEFRFWTYGEAVPNNSNYQYLTLVIPDCNNSNQVICNNRSTKPNQITNTTGNSANQGSGGKVFKPWNPNATRNEKGLRF